LILVTRDPAGKLIGPGTVFEVSRDGRVERWQCSVVTEDGYVGWAGWPDGTIVASRCRVIDHEWSGSTDDFERFERCFLPMCHTAEAVGYRGSRARPQLAALQRSRRLAEWARRGWGWKELRDANVKRMESGIFKHPPWTPAQWAWAAAGEEGELVNAVKKLCWRGDGRGEDVLSEGADVLIYLDLCLAEAGAVWAGKPGREAPVSALGAADPSPLRLEDDIAGLRWAMNEILLRRGPIDVEELGEAAVGVAHAVVRLASAAIKGRVDVPAMLLDTFNAVSVRKSCDVLMPLGFDPLAERSFKEGEWRVVEPAAGVVA
jgi:hypothetical protein